MKVLMINGSPKPNGNTAVALEEMKQVFAAEGIEVASLHVGNLDIRGCTACGQCYDEGNKVDNDVHNGINYGDKSNDKTDDGKDVTR